MATSDEIVARLSRTWDFGDSVGWAANFEADAEFVDVLGRRQKGRSTIEREHRKLFESIYAGSTCAFRVIAEQELDAALRLLHTASRLTAPSGPRQGETFATQTMLVRGDLIAAFHNTVQAELDSFTQEKEGFGAPDKPDGGSSEPRDPTI